MMTDFLFLGGIFIIAILYSSVGHGGASGYLAFMALLSFVPEVMRPSALILNVFVSTIAFISFARNGHFRMKLLWPFIVTSVPFAFIGGTFNVDARIYKIILGVFLLFAVARMLMKVKSLNDIREIHVLLALAIGGVLGFFSGLIGIGGGIILSPIIILLGWASVKQTAAVSSVFILVNSLAGLTGFVMNNKWPEMEIGYMILVGVIGGLLGSYFGSFRIGEKYLRYGLALVLLFASVKLIVL
jgi:uncharacterized membrane protein YfcA